MYFYVLRLEWFSDVTIKEKETIKGIVVPHAGWVYAFYLFSFLDTLVELRPSLSPTCKINLWNVYLCWALATDTILSGNSYSNRE